MGTRNTIELTPREMRIIEDAYKLFDRILRESVKYSNPECEKGKSAKDPTRKEIIKFLKTYSELESVRISWIDLEVEEAIYWFAYDFNTGKGSNLYKVLVNSKYDPPVVPWGVRSGAEFLYNLLKNHFG